MAAKPAKPKGKGLGRKVGPFSAWVYLVIGLAAVGLILYLRHRKAAAGSAEATTAEGALAGGPSIQPVPGGYASGGGGGGFAIPNAQGPADTTAGTTGTNETGGVSSDIAAALASIGTDFENAVNFFNERGGVTGLDQAYQSGQWHDAYPNLTDAQAKTLYDALRARLAGAPASQTVASATTAPPGYAPAFPDSITGTALAPTPSTEQAAFQLTGDPLAASTSTAFALAGGAQPEYAGDFAYDPTPKVGGRVPPWKTSAPDVPPPGMTT